MKGEVSPQHTVIIYKSTFKCGDGGVLHISINIIIKKRR